MIILFWNPFSPYSRKVKMALDHKGLAYSCVMEGLFGEGGASVELKLKSPRGEVPIIQDGDLVIWDSRVICEYLEDACPANPLLPEEPAQRARCRRLEALCDSALDAAIYAVFAGRVICKDAPLASAMAAQGSDEVRVLVEQFERELGSQQFLCGDRLCLADIALYTQLVGVVPLGVALDTFSGISAWMMRIRQTAMGERDAVDVEEAFARARASTKQLRHQWRGERIEFAFRHGLEAFLQQEVQRGRAYFPPSPSAQPSQV